MTAFQSFFLMSVLALFALTVAWGFCKLIGWAWRKCFGPHESDFPS